MKTLLDIHLAPKASKLIPTEPYHNLGDTPTNSKSVPRYFGRIGQNETKRK